MEKIKLVKYGIDIIDNPLETLSKSDRNKLVQACIPVARKGFGHEGITESDIELHALDVTTGIYVSNEQGEVVGFGGCVLEEVDGEKIVHLKGSAIMPEHQSSGLYKIITPVRVLREVEKEGTDLYVGSRTQNPRVFEFMSNVLGLYPQVDEDVPERMKTVAEGYASIVQNKHSDFVPKDGIVFDKNILAVRRAYGGVDENGEEFGFCMYGDNVPPARNQRTNQFITENLDFQNGDAIILLGQFSKDDYLNCLQSIKKLDPDGKMYRRFSKF